MSKNKLIWYSIDKKQPPIDGTSFLSAYKYIDGWVYTQAKFSSFHPNAKGKECFRDSVGHKIQFSHWTYMPNSPGGEPRPAKIKITNIRRGKIVPPDEDDLLIDIGEPEERK